MKAVKERGSGYWARWITDKYIFLMLTVFPLFTGFSGYANITFSKYIFFVVVTSGWLLAPVAVVAANVIIRRRRRISPAEIVRAIRPCEWAVACFMLAACLSAFFSPYQEHVFIGAGRYEGLASILLYGFVFLIISRFGKSRRGYFLAFGVSVCLCCIVACVQLFGYNPFWLYPGDMSYYDAHILYTGEFLGTIGNANLLSAFLCIAIPLFTVLFFTGEKRTDAIFLIPAALGMFILAASRVSGGIVALAVSAAICFPILLRNRQRLSRALFACGVLAFSVGAAFSLTPEYSGGIVRMKVLASPSVQAFVFSGFIFWVLSGIFHLRKNRSFPSPGSLSVFFSLLFAVLIVSGIFFVYFRPPGTSGTLYELSLIMHGDIRDEFGSSRIKIWRETLELIPERPFFGGGPDTLAKRLGIEFSRYVPETGKTLRTFVDNAHNEYLGYLVNIGIFGLLPYLAAMFFSLSAWTRKKDSSGSAAALGCALVCYWAQGFFGLGLCITAPFLWIIWGLFEASDTRRDSPSDCDCMLSLADKKEGEEGGA